MKNEERIIELLEQVLAELKQQNSVNIPFVITDNKDLVDYSEICACNPKNGGSGICNCVLAGTKITC